MNKIELCNINTCTQCYACKTVCPKDCITMVDAEAGFHIPSIDRNKCIECGACMKVCHVISPRLTPDTPIKTFACWTKNHTDRSNSSSGGAFSVLARKILADGGIVYGASMMADLQVKHIAIERSEELIKLQGSKYVQSYLGEIFKDVHKKLLAGTTILFSGTPCQIAGLKTYLRKDYANLYTCDVVCHGVPSQTAFNIYIDKIGIRDTSKNVTFRFTEGWGFRLSHARQPVAPALDGASSKRVIMPAKGYYLRAFTAGLMFSEACYQCSYAHPERISDFTLADYWGLGDEIPFDYPTQRGISCMLVNTPKALSFIDACDELKRVERPLSEAIKGNHNLSHVSTRPAGRDSYFEDSVSLSIAELSAKYCIKPTFRDYLRILKQDLFLLRNK